MGGISVSIMKTGVKKGCRLQGRRKYCYTKAMVAELSGRSIWTVRKDVRSGALDMGDVMAVACYVNRYRTTNPQDTAKAPADAEFSGKKAEG